MSQKWIHALHRLFNPELRPDTPSGFSLKYPQQEEDQPPDVTPAGTVPTPTWVQVTPLKYRAADAEQRVTESLAELKSDMHPDLTMSLGQLRQGLHMKKSSDLVIREFFINFPTPVKAALLFYDGIVNGRELNDDVLFPLMNCGTNLSPGRGGELLRQIEFSALNGRSTQLVFRLEEVMGLAVAGLTLLLVDGAAGAISLDLRQFPSRNVSEPKNEQVIRGPQEGFTEVLRTNTALLRHRLMHPDLCMETALIGRKSRNYCAISYLAGIANPDLLDEIRRRMARIDTDLIIDSGMLEQFIEDHPHSIFPTVINTQRPDRVAAALAEGRVAILMDGSPAALVVPAVITDFLRNPEDYYVKWPFGTLLRLVRLFGLGATLLLPGAYIAVANFHPEMIPAGLMLSIAASREPVPFPAVVEVVLMELSFEIIREGSLRIPSIMGQTVGIVGALILGQAAVQAAIVSPILVIIVAATALGSFTIPDYGFGLAARIIRFGFILLGATFGLYGISAGLFFMLTHLASLRSFGVPFTAPFGPRQETGPDKLLRGSLFDMDTRPEIARPLERQRQSEETKSKSPYLVDPEKEKGAPLA